MTRFMIYIFELLQVSLGVRDRLSRVPSDAQWGALLDESRNQAIAGIMLCGLERLPKEQRPPIDTLLEWIGEAQITEAENELALKTCQKVCETLGKDGFRSCVLKGQANHAYYPGTMGKRRSCGDVDVWTAPKEEGRCKKEDVKRVLEYIEKNHELTGLCWLHCDFDDENGVPVEVHFHPSFMNDPVHNRRFQEYFADFNGCVVEKKVDGVTMPALRVEKDVIYQMNHIYRHLLDEGVGLRQVVDYFFLLKNYTEINGLSDRSINTDSKDYKDTEDVLRHLGMRKFAGALMWVMKVVCGMPDEYLLCQPVEKDGQFLLHEIIMSGNFGHSDPRMVALDTSSVLMRRLTQAWRRFKRNLRFLGSYPREVIWEPFARMYHFAWKLCHRDTKNKASHR